MQFRYFGLREGAKRGVERLHDEALHDLHYRFCGVMEGADRGMEKTAL